MDPDFVRYQEALARTVANNNRLAGVAITISVISLAVAIYAVAYRQSESSESFAASTTINPENTVFGKWLVTESHASEAKAGDRITIARDKITVASHDFMVLGWDRSRIEDTEWHTASISDGDGINIAVGPPGRGSIGLRTGIVSVKRENDYQFPILLLDTSRSDKAFVYQVVGSDLYVFFAQGGKTGIESRKWTAVPERVDAIRNILHSSREREGGYLPGEMVFSSFGGGMPNKHFGQRDLPALATWADQVRRDFESGGGMPIEGVERMVEALPEAVRAWLANPSMP